VQTIYIGTNLLIYIHAGMVQLVKRTAAIIPRVPRAAAAETVGMPVDPGRGNAARDWRGAGA